MPRQETIEAAQYKEVRGLTRGLQVLWALNAMAGGMGSVAQLAKATGMHRTTVKRLLETLKAAGAVHRKDDGNVYALTFEVRRLSEGYVASDWIDTVAAPAMRNRLRALSWPSDIATPDAGFMIVRESTHRFSMLSQHRSMIGIRIPMLVSAVGRAWLAFCADEDREATLRLLRTRTDAYGELARDQRAVNKILADTRKRGYGLNIGEWLSEASVAAIAFPVMDGDSAIAALNLVLVRDAVNTKEIRTRYVPLLRELAGEISSAVTQRSKAVMPEPS